MGINLLDVLVLVMCVVVHEISHGYAALLLGDKTAKYAGRLTLNPLKHIDLWGSIILPIILALLPGGLVFGYAKPVPVNPYNLRNRRYGEAIVAFAGPLSNIFLAVFFALLLRFGLQSGLSLPVEFVGKLILINIVLAVFNMVPVPPLDGSKVLFGLLGTRGEGFRRHMERFGLIYIIIFIFFLWDLVSPLIIKIFDLLIGGF